MLIRENSIVDSALMTKMSAAMSHRGPDDQGVYVSRKIGLGHRRLSIIDLQTGKQPLSNENGSIWVVFNGEIYNFKELRKELLNNGHVFQTHTDTEVIVHLYEEYEEKFVSKLRGMFAIALWDETLERLILARDRVGIKPLYYYLTDSSIIFASEIKALLVDRTVPREVNAKAIRLLMSYNYIPGDETLMQGVKKVLPGHYIVIRNGKCRDSEYWDLSFSKTRSHLQLRDAVPELNEILRKSVRDHMISDVPVGFLLSGGVDSTALLSYAVEETDKKISTFTIGFEGQNFEDERYYARLAAKCFGTQHYDMTISANDFLDFLPKYVWHMEEPICEPPAVALYYISRLAKDHVKVLLSGEGGDEAFAGYPEYRNFLALERIKTLSGSLRKIIGRVITMLTDFKSLRRFNRYGHFMSVDFENYYFSRTSTPLSFMNRYAEKLYRADFYELSGRDGMDDFRQQIYHTIDDFELLDKMLYIDTKTWLPDDLLLKADKITMANSVELRVPFLDHGVLEYAASLPTDFKLKGLTTKYILRKAFKRRIPKEILNRKKTGFPVPYDRWLSRELNTYVRDVLLDRRTRERGYFNSDAILQMLDSHQKRPTYSKEIFLLIVLELWHRTFIDQGFEQGFSDLTPNDFEA